MFSESCKLKQNVAGGSEISIFTEFSSKIKSIFVSILFKFFEFFFTLLITIHIAFFCVLICFKFQLSIFVIIYNFSTHSLMVFLSLFFVLLFQDLGIATRNLDFCSESITSVEMTVDCLSTLWDFTFPHPIYLRLNGFSLV